MFTKSKIKLFPSTFADKYLKSLKPVKLGQVKLRSLFNNLAAWQKGLKTCQPWSLEHKLSHKGQLSQVYKERLHTFRKKNCYLFSRELPTKEWGGRRSCPKLHHDFGRKKSHFQLKNEAAQKTRQKTAREKTRAKHQPAERSCSFLFHSAQC